MHFRPFSVKKKSYFFDFIFDFADFWDFFTDFFDIGLLIPQKPPIPHGSPPLSFYIKNRQKNRFSDAYHQKPVSDS